MYAVAQITRQSALALMGVLTLGYKDCVPTNPDLADILGDMGFDVDNFQSLCFFLISNVCIFRFHNSGFVDFSNSRFPDF